MPSCWWRRRSLLLLLLLLASQPMRLLSLLRRTHQHRHRPFHHPLLYQRGRHAAMTTMATPTPDALRHSILEGLRRRLRPVQRIDTDARRYAQEREAFKAYLFGRFGLASLAAQGEESSVRRVVHAHLLAADAEYRGWVEDELPSLADPWSTADPADRFAPVPARLTSASQRDAYLPAAKAGRAAVDRAMGQLELGLEVARRKVEEAQEEEEAKAARAALVVREGRLAEMAGKRERFDAVLAVLSRIDGRLVEAREEALSRLARRQSSGGGVAPSSSPPPPPPRDTSAWGKAAEREAEAAMEAVVAEVNDQLQGSGGPPLRLLSSVLFKGLDGDDMVRLREAALAEGRAELYGTEVERPKGEIDLLVVRPAPDDDDGRRLQVILAVEVKRSLDEVAADCLKLHLLLDMCRRADPTNTSRTSSSGALRFACGRGRHAGPSSEDGFVLDFAAAGPPAEASVYVAKRGGPTLRAASKMMLEVVQLLRTTPPRSSAAAVASEDGEGESGDEEALRLLRERLLAFYAPDFVDSDGGAAAEAAAAAMREGVVDELWGRFQEAGLARLEARLRRITRALTGAVPWNGEAEGAAAAAVELRSVFALGFSGGEDGSSSSA